MSGAAEALIREAHDLAETTRRRLAGGSLLAKANTATALVANALRRHERAILLFSGGKESVVLAHLAESYKNRITLVWVNTGAAFPHMVEFVRGYGERFKLVELNSNLPEHLLARGLPSMIVPMNNHWTSLRGRAFAPPGHRALINDWVACCSEVRWKPIIEYLAQSRIYLAIHGQRRQDDARPGSRTTEMLAPLWDWSTDDVMRYVKQHNLELPMQYPEILEEASSTGGSMDCSLCTAGVSPTRIRWIREHYPDTYETLKPMLKTLYGAVAAEWEQLVPGLQEANGNP